MRVLLLHHANPHIALPHRYELTRFEQVAQEMGIQLTLATPEQLELYLEGSVSSVMLDAHPYATPDRVIVRMGAFASYFALASMRHFESMGVPVINPSAGTLLARDKFATLQRLSQAGLPIPKTLIPRYPFDMERIGDSLGFPVVIKALHGAMGSGVYLAETPQNLQDVLLLLATTQPNTPLLLQAFVAPSYGRDIRAFVVGEEVIGCMERHNTTGGFKANVSRGGGTRPLIATPDITSLAIQATRALGLHVAGVDLLYGQEGLVLCEVNASPGFKGLEETLPQVNVARAYYTLSFQQNA